MSLPALSPRAAGFEVLIHAFWYLGRNRTGWRGPRQRSSVTLASEIGPAKRSESDLIPLDSLYGWGYGKQK